MFAGLQKMTVLCKFIEMREGYFIKDGEFTFSNSLFFALSEHMFVMVFKFDFDDVALPYFFDCFKERTRKNSFDEVEILRSL